MYSVLEKFSHNIILDEIAHLLENGKIINAVKAVIHERGNCVVRVSFRDQTDYQIDVERGSFEDTWNEACAILMAVTNITEGIDRLTVNQISKLEKDRQQNISRQQEYHMREAENIWNEQLVQATRLFEAGLYDEFLGKFGGNCKELPRLIRKRIEIAEKKVKESQ